MKTRLLTMLFFLILFPVIVTALPEETQYVGIISVNGNSGTTSKGSMDDGFWGPEPIGFNFEFFGNTYTEFYFSSNGLLSFGNGSTTYSNTDIPNTSAPNNYIAPFWDDIMIDATGVIYYQTIGAAPNRKLIVQWTNMIYYGENTLFGTFQCIIYEGSNEIQMQYRNIVDNTNPRSYGSEATIGLENIDGTAGAKYSYNQTNAISEEMAILWTPSGTSYIYNDNAIYEGVVLVESITNPEPGIADLLSPDNSSVVGTNVLFKWEPAENTDSYQLMIWDAGESTTTPNADSYNAGTNLEYSLTFPSGLGYKWAVFSQNTTGETWSQIRNFSTSDSPPLAAVSKNLYIEETQELTIQLDYTGGDESPKTASVTSLPTAGQLFQYDNGAFGSEITSVPSVVTDASFNLIYVANGGSGNGIGSFNVEFADNTYTSGESTITINVSPPGTPNLQSAAYSGNTIELSFDKALKDVSGKDSEFNVTLNGVTNPVTSVALKEGDPSTIVVTLQSPQLDSDSKLISYTQGTIESTEGGLLESFIDQPAVKETQNITFTEIPDKTTGSDPFTLSATASSGGTVSFSTSNSSVISISGTTATINGLGTVEITAIQEGDANTEYAQHKQEVIVTKENQTITFNALTEKEYGNANFDLNASASSGLPVSFTSSNSNVATIIDNTVTITGAGQTTITASQDGNSNYNAATPVSHELLINKATLTATADLQTKVYGTAVPELTFQYSGFVLSQDASSLISEPSVTTTVDETSVVSVYPEVISVSGGDAANYAFSYVPADFEVTKATLTVTADAQTKNEGDVFLFTGNEFLVTGILNGDAVTSASLMSEGSTAEASSINSPYPIVVSDMVGSGLENYNISYVAGSLEVNSVPTSSRIIDANDFGIQIYPNPSQGIVYLNLNEKHAGEITINVLNMHGQKVLHKKVQPSEEPAVDLSALPSGIYFIQTKINGEPIIQKVFLK